MDSFILPGTMFGLHRSPQRPGGITVIQSSYLMVSSGNNNFLTCTNGNRYIGNIKVFKFYLVVGTNVDEMGWDRERCKTIGYLVMWSTG